MAIERNTAEGQASGTTLTAANSGGGSGDQFDQVVNSGSGLGQYSNEEAMYGNQSYKITSGASSAVYIMYDTVSDANGAAQMYINATAFPSTNQLVLNIRTASGSATICGIGVNTTGSLRLTNAAGGTVTTSPDLLVLGVWTRIDLRVEVGASTSTGRIAAAAYTANSSTPLWSFDTGYTANAGTTNIGNYRFGKLDTAPTMGTFYIDELAVDTGGTAFIPPRQLATVGWFTA